MIQTEARLINVNCNPCITNVTITEKYSNIRPSEVDNIKKKKKWSRILAKSSLLLAKQTSSKMKLDCLTDAAQSTAPQSFS